MINVTKKNGVAWVELDKPPVNVLDKALLDELTSKLKELASDDSIGAVLLSGAGRCFSAGASVEEHSKELAPGMIGALKDACDALSATPVPVVALVHGACMGGGLELVLYADFIVADPGAKLGVPEVTLAFFPPFASARLPAIIGRQNAAWLALTGEIVTAERAREMGLVQVVLEKDKWAEVADRFGSLSRPVLRLAVEAIRIGESQGLERQLDLFLNKLYLIEDVKEGIASFGQRRKPVWKHK